MQAARIFFREKISLIGSAMQTDSASTNNGMLAFEAALTASEKDPNSKEVEDLLLKAANLGLPVAVLELIWYYQRNGIVNQETKWIDRLKMIAENGDAASFYFLYLALRSQLPLEGVSKDAVEQWNSARLDLQKRYLRQGARRGVPEAQTDLAISFLRENDTAADFNSFEYWINEAVSQGFVPAVCCYVEELLKRRRPVPDWLKKRLREAVAASDRAARLVARL